MIHVVIDTNIYISILSNPSEYEYNLKNELYGEIIADENIKNDYYRENKLPKKLLDLEILCRNKVVKLLVPEVTLLELEKADLEVKERYHKYHEDLKDKIDLSENWNEMKYLKDNLKAIITKNELVSIENWELGYNQLRKFLLSAYNEYIELDNNDICSLYRNTISGKIKDRQSNDFLFLSSVYKYVNNKGTNEDIVILITHDKKDFYNKKIVDNDGRNFFELKDYFKDNRTEIKGLNNMESLYKYINADINLSNKISNILDTEIGVTKNSEEEEFDEENIEDLRWFVKEEIRQRVIDIFNSKNKSFQEINNLRTKVILDINNKLEECRNLNSWNDRSELKLYTWLEEWNEEELEIVKLSTLLLIKENIEEYYRIHKNIT